MKDTARALLIHPGDTVAVALDEVPQGAVVTITGSADTFQVKALELIPFAHKIAVLFVAKGSPIVKYGVNVAFATADIQIGAWVHVQNAGSYCEVQGERERS